jgi:hypothetical protein
MSVTHHRQNHLECSPIYCCDTCHLPVLAGLILRLELFDIVLLNCGMWRCCARLGNLYTLAQIPAAPHHIHFTLQALK